ncbi:MAG: WG repeat-containing protein, partial [Saprospiraceae bacterium]
PPTQQELLSDYPDTLPPLPGRAADYDPSQYRWGFADQTGRLLISDAYDEVRAFSQDRAVVRRNGRWSFIDRRGLQVGKQDYAGAWTFHDGRARVRDDNDKLGFINRNGDYVIAANWEEAGDFFGGLAKVGRDGLYGLLDTTGKLVVPPVYEKLSATDRPGLFTVQANGRTGTIDGTGRVLLPPEFEALRPPGTEGLIRYRQGGKWGFVDSLGKVVVAARFEQAADFSDGRAPVQVGEQWKLIDRRGKIVSRLAYDQLVPAGLPGKFVAETAGKYGLIDQDERVIVPLRLDELHPFTDGLAAYRVDDGWGFLRPDGSLLTDPVYPLVWPFVNGRARVIDDRVMVYIDTTGRMLYPGRYLDMRDYQEDLAPVQVYRPE